ncbi:hypothetical protein [Defluviitalea phaphyphila]|uniref:hypothetical protein n=1 Tax=Defluviitalea phaphyphila TaxID=1473580 RepID=UPI000731A7C7|nr:hypothetical protein [Defluviitalea phaphyphila]
MKRFRVYLLIIIVMLFTSACNNESKIEETKESISEFIIMFDNIIHEEDIDGFLNFIDENGIYSITYFDDGRDENRAVLVFKEDVREDLFLVSSQSGKAGISLGGGLTFPGRIEDVYFNDFEIEDNILSNIDWKVKDEKVIQKQLPDILNGLKEIILKNNECIPQVFRLSENMYAFSYSDIDEEEPQYFYGYWILFEEIDGSYYIRAIIELQ